MREKEVDSTEIHYISYDPDTIWLRMMDAYMQAGGDVLYAGDEKEMLLRSVQQMIIQGYAEVDNALRMATRRYAVRDYLDLYGESHFCPRIQSVAATALVEITFSAGSEATIPSGTTLTEDGVIIYQLTEDVAASAEAQTVQAAIQCQTTGSAGNGLLSGAQMQFLSQQDRVVQVVCVQSATGGTDQEQDEPYRERIGNQNPSTTGPSGRYEAEAMAVSSEILDAKAVNLGAGAVGVYLIFGEGANKEALIAAVGDALSPADVRPLNDLVTVDEADEVAYAITVTVYVSQYATLTQPVSDTVAAYRTWQENTVGRAFNPDMLTAMLYQSGVTRVEYAEGSGMEGSMAYQEIGEDEHCVGTVTATTVII